MPIHNVEQFVSIDLETTGLKAGVDEIIEVGIVKFDLLGNHQEFQTLVRPESRLTSFISNLTGLIDKDLRDAPIFDVVRNEIEDFIGDLPIIGHNIQFDISFLKTQGVKTSNSNFDTWELGALLLPTAEKLNLASLAELLGVQVERSHRALDDAICARDIFIVLYQRLQQLPEKTLADMRMFLSRSDSSIITLLPETSTPRTNNESYLDFQAKTLTPSVNTNSEVGTSSMGYSVSEIWNFAEQTQTLLKDYIPRVNQQLMSEVIEENLITGGELVLEAGTGTGKTLAYLLPALIRSVTAGERVVVSTQTKNLQDQLKESDLPIAIDLVDRFSNLNNSNSTREPQINVQVLKGKSNYLCLERWFSVRSSQAKLKAGESRFYARVATWLEQTSSGDSAELYMTSRDEETWRNISATDTDCLSRRCEFAQDGSCFVLRAREKASMANIVIVNHALLLANATQNEQILPNFDHLIIDEGHRLEDVATDHFGSMISIKSVEDLLKSGLAQDKSERKNKSLSFLGHLRALELYAQGNQSEIEKIVRTRDIAIGRLRELREGLRDFFENHADARDPGRITSDHEKRQQEFSLTAGARSQPAWEELTHNFDLLLSTLKFLRREVEQLLRLVRAQHKATSQVDLQELTTAINRFLGELSGVSDAMQRVVIDESPRDITWISRRDRDIRLGCAPLVPGDRLREYLFEDRKSVLVTSATLQDIDTSGLNSFRFILEQLGLPDASTSSWPAPFNYRNQAKVVIVNDIVNPGDADYPRQLHEAIFHAVNALRGRTIVLFTSHDALRKASAALRDRLAEIDVRLLSQGVDGSATRLVRELQSGEPTVIFGAAALWEGVDIPGRALSQIIVVRLPFPSPVDPIHAARGERYEDSFSEYLLPRAILRFRQGFGRLIRHEGDKGIFTILDSRFLTARYGAQFAQSLPDTPIETVRLVDLQSEVSNWLTDGSAR
jgi:DNA polymerase-3 subunit epsilon/ATP-dependent DNA helicase DinG